jgi:hypothetical protein
MPDTEPEIADGIDRKSPASDRKRPRESLHNVSICWTILLSSLRTCGRLGFARFLAPLHEQILELAVQPDSWGERTRARLIAEVFAGLKRDSSRRCACGGNRAVLKCCGALLPSRTGTPKTAH